MVGFRTNGIALPRKGRTKEGPGMEPFLTMYEICSRRSRRRVKHARYEVSSVKEKEAKRDASVRAFILLSYRTVCGQCREREREREEIYYGGRGNNKKKKKKGG